jgi:hypothetical protein
MMPPPGAIVTNPLTGETAPIQATSPAKVPSWGELFRQGLVRPEEEPPPVPVPGEPGAAEFQTVTDLDPRSVGAAGTPYALAKMTARQIKAARYDAEMTQIEAPATPGDERVIVPGSFPTLAERSGDTKISSRENFLRQEVPDVFTETLAGNNNARVKQIEDATPSKTQIESWESERADQWEKDTAGMLPKAKPVDLQPVATWAEGLLNDPRIQENDAVYNTVQNFYNRLFDADGQLKTDPRAAWGMHDNLQNLMLKAKDPLAASPAEKFSFAQLMAAKERIDIALNVATDGQFQKALDNFAQASQRINAGKLFLEAKPGLTNTQGEIYGDRFHRFVIDLAKRRGVLGIDDAMSIPDDVMQKMIDIDTDLKRAGLVRLGAPKGAQTSFMNEMRNRMATEAVRSVVGEIPVVGKPLNAIARAMVFRREAAKHLVPPEGGYLHPVHDAAGNWMGYERQPSPP